MSNLYFGVVKTDSGEYKNLATETGITLTENSSYLIENRNGYTLYLCAQATAPTNGAGFTLTAGEKVTYKHGSVPLFFRTKGTIINISE